MGFFDALVDPLDIGGSGAAEATVETAQTNADLLRRFSDVSQANLQPFLEAGNRQLPGLEFGASPEGFFNQANELRPIIQGIQKPVVEDRLRDLSSVLGAAGKTRSGAAGLAAADIQQDADLSLLLQLQSVLTGRQQTIAGQGTQTGGQLAELGLEAGETLGDIQSRGILGGQQARAAGQQNLLKLAGLSTDFANRPATPATAPVL